MRRLVRALASRLPSPAALVAVIALLATGAGAATAARMIGGKDIRRGAIATKHVRSDAITGGKVAERAIRRRHLAPSAQPRRGPPGPPGEVELRYPFVVATVPDGEESDGRQGVECTDGLYPTGGSAAAYDPETDAMVLGVITGSQAGFIDDDGVPHGWSAEWQNDSGGPVTVVVEVVCTPAAEVSSPTFGMPPAPEPDRGHARPAPPPGDPGR